MKHSVTLFISISIFFILDAFIFFTYKKNIQESFTKEVEISFWKIETKSSELLSALLYKYSLQVEQIRKKHRDVQEIIEHSGIEPLKFDLQALFKKINKGFNPPRYNIYISDENLVIKNTTFQKDLGFDLAFAKDIFERHFNENTIGVSTPVFETSTRSFFSYSDSYYKCNKNPKCGILQLSYTYCDVTSKFHELRQLIRKNSMIEMVKAYIKLNDGFVAEIKISDTKSYKPKLDKILASEKDGESIDTLIVKQGLTKIEKEDSLYYFFSVKSPIDANISILYHIKFSKSKLKERLKLFYQIAVLATLLGLFTLYILLKIFQKEQRLVWQDIFIQSVMHQLKTPLTLIRINNEMQQIQYSNTPYIKNIEAGVKTLQNSFDDMHFFFKNEKRYPVETLSLEKVLKERINYFDAIAKAYEKKIDYRFEGDTTIHMSEEELIRLIDNNISNAIKYAKPNSDIIISLQENTLTFITHSQPIKDTKRLFEKYYREESSKGGYGLGLFIVHSIAKKYKIVIELDSNDNATTFGYVFKGD